MTQYDFTKTPVAVDRLTQEIQQSSIITALDHISMLGSALSIFFKADLSTDDQTTLSTIITNHSGLPLPQNIIDSVAVVSQPMPEPFATPSYRTKRDGSDWITCTADSTTDLDFQLTTERYVSGGQLFLKDIKEGDWLSAEVYDKDSLIPSPYRAALCEAWPCVAKYIVKANIQPCSGYDNVKVDTYPLNAKISAGLYLRVSLHTTSETGDRKMAINYFLTKKL